LKLASVPEAESIPIYIGGPVHPGEVFILHGPPFHWEGCLMITPNLALSNTLDLLKAISAGEGPASFIIGLGCAGWAPGQLENEVLQNAWLTCAATEEILFHIPPEERWEATVRRLGIDPTVLSGIAGHA
jgi:putative transcriptional regulator